MQAAYSYIRFSSKRQADGDSLRRQVEARDKWLVAHPGVRLVEDYRDLGMSGWRGRNTAIGNLRKFLDLVEAGKIKRGSYLLLENLDRLTRTDVTTALNLLTGLMLKGIQVVTLMDGRLYSDARKQDTMSDLMLALVYMSRAGDESEVKSDRSLATWINKRKTASASKPLTGMIPAWLMTEDGRIVTNEHSPTIQTIFRWAADGHTAVTILRRLEAEHVPSPTAGRRKDGGRWSLAYVWMILRNRAVLGELQPGIRGPDGKQTATGDVVRDAYPQIVEQIVWDRAQAALEDRRVTWVKRGEGKSDFQRRARTADTAGTLFAGLCRCQHCGGPLSFMRVNRGRQSYVRCLGRYVARNCTDGRHYRYQPLEDAVLDGIEHLLEVAPPASEYPDIEPRMAEATADVERCSKRVRRLTVLLADDDDPDAALEFVAAKAAARIARDRLSGVHLERSRTSAAIPASDRLERVRALRRASQDSDEAVRRDARAALAVAVRSLVETMQFDSSLATTVKLRDNQGWLRVRAGQLVWAYLSDYVALSSARHAEIDDPVHHIEGFVRRDPPMTWAETVSPKHTLALQ